MNKQELVAELTRLYKVHAEASLMADNVEGPFESQDDTDQAGYIKHRARSLQEELYNLMQTHGVSERTRQGGRKGENTYVAFVQGTTILTEFII